MFLKPQEMNNETLKIEEGTINFWIKENSLDFSDNNSTQIFNINPEGGSILCVKDNDNKLKFFFVVIGKGREDVEFDVTNQEQSKRHMITFMWNLKNKELNLYFDGENKVKKTINF